MTRDEAKSLVQEIHAAYPSWRLDDPQGTINFWHQQFEEVDLELVRKAFHQYVDNDDRTYAPQVGQLKKIVQKLKGSQIQGCTMVFDSDFNVIHWKPSPDSEVIDIPVTWSYKRKCYVDDEGREYIDPSVDYSDKITRGVEKRKVHKPTEDVANQIDLSTLPPRREDAWIFE